MLTNADLSFACRHCDSCSHVPSCLQKRKQLYDVSFMEQAPCGVCPVMNSCTEHGVINPQSCVYMGKWLQQEAEAVYDDRDMLDW